MSEPAAERPRSWTLRCRDLCVQRSGRDVLRNINLNLEAGQCLALIGPNGAGKTTLMMTMLGLLRPVRGAVELDGKAIADVAPRSRGRWASYVPQTLDGMPDFTVRDVVAAGRYPHVAPLAPVSARDLAVIDAALSQSGLTELADRPVNAVSGGERQKTLIAAAVAQDADVMFLDEPNTALDPAYQIDLVRTLRDWHARGRGAVIISHDLQLPAVLEARVAAMRDGVIVADGPVEEILRPDRLREIFNAEFEIMETSSGPQIVVPRLWSEASD